MEVLRAGSPSHSIQPVALSSVLTSKRLSYLPVYAACSDDFALQTCQRRFPQSSAGHVVTPMERAFYGSASQAARPSYCGKKRIARGRFALLSSAPMTQPKPEKSPMGESEPEKTYSLDEMSEITKYTDITFYQLMKKGLIARQPSRGRVSQTQIDQLLARRKDPKIRKGRVKGPAKRPQQFRMRFEIIDIVKKIRALGGKVYKSNDAAIEHCVMHADTCPEFKPGEMNLVWSKDGKPQEPDLEGL